MLILKFLCGCYPLLTNTSLPQCQHAGVYVCLRAEAPGPVCVSNAVKSGGGHTLNPFGVPIVSLWCVNGMKGLLLVPPKLVK